MKKNHTIILTITVFAFVIFGFENVFAAEFQVSIPSGTSTPGCESDNSCYVPYELHVDMGDTVVWSNDDSAAHTVTSGTTTNGPADVFNSSLFMAGNTFSHTFTENGEYSYYCILHPWMIGIIFVGDATESQDDNDIGDNESVVETDNQQSQQDKILVSTDKMFYDVGDTLTVSAKRGKMVQLFNPSYDLILISQGGPPYQFAIGGTLWEQKGTYTVMVSDGADSGKITFFVGVPKIELPAKEQLSIENARSINAFGNLLSEISVDQQVQITADITNNQGFEQTFAYVVTVEGKEGILSEPQWITGLLAANQQLSPSLSWMPKSPGIHTVTIEVWDNPVDRLQIAEPAKITINVFGDDSDVQKFESLENEIADFVDPTMDPQYYLDRYNKEPNYKEWFDKKYPSMTIEDAVGYVQVQEKIPSWIKNNAKWWSEGQIGNTDFVLGIQYMVNEKIIGITDVPVTEPTAKIADFVDPTKDPQYYLDRYNNEPNYKEWFDKNHPDLIIEDAIGFEQPTNIPDWIRNNAGWWADGLITEDDFIKGIEFLVEKGIIRVS